MFHVFCLSQNNVCTLTVESSLLGAGAIHALMLSVMLDPRLYISIDSISTVFDLVQMHMDLYCATSYTSKTQLTIAAPYMEVSTMLLQAHGSIDLATDETYYCHLDVVLTNVTQEKSGTHHSTCTGQSLQLRSIQNVMLLQSAIALALPACLYKGTSLS